MRAPNLPGSVAVRYPPISVPLGLLTRVDPGRRRGRWRSVIRPYRYPWGFLQGSIRADAGVAGQVESLVTSRGRRLGSQDHFEVFVPKSRPPFREWYLCRG